MESLDYKDSPAERTLASLLFCTIPSRRVESGVDNILPEKVVELHDLEILKNRVKGPDVDGLEVGSKRWRHHIRNMVTPREPFVLVKPRGRCRLAGARQVGKTL